MLEAWCRHGGEQALGYGIEHYIDIKYMCIGGQ